MVTRTTGIEWTDKTWNPTTGCDKVSPGCDNCYADALSRRLQAMGNSRYTRGFQLTLHPDKLREPLRWREPARIFVNSMSDLLHRDVPDEFLVRCFRVMHEANWHEFHVLTKRPGRWASVSELVTRDLGRWPVNVLPGTSVEHRPALARLNALARAGDEATTRMVSVEPLLEDLGEPADLAERLARARVGWVITGGEAGFHARPAELDWFRRVRDACVMSNIPYFHKQHGGRGVTKAVKRGGEAATLDGVLWHQHPPDRRAPAPSRASALPLFR